MDVDAYKAREVLDGEEQIAIALHLPSWCPKNKRGTKSAFQRFNTSVSRLAITPIADIVGIFIAEVGKGVRLIEGYGVCRVREVEAAAQGSETTKLVVTADPKESNPAHAEIIAFNKDMTELRKKVPDGVALNLAKLIEVHVLDTSTQPKA